MGGRGSWEEKLIWQKHTDGSEGVGPHWSGRAWGLMRRHGKGSCSVIAWPGTDGIVYFNFSILQVRDLSIFMSQCELMVEPGFELMPFNSPLIFTDSHQRVDFVLGIVQLPAGYGSCPPHTDCFPGRCVWGTVQMESRAIPAVEEHMEGELVLMLQGRQDTGNASQVKRILRELKASWQGLTRARQALCYWAKSPSLMLPFSCGKAEE